jgi:DNA adenine methylase
MQYLGGKSRTAKPICDFLNKLISDNDIDTYVEPFCGACNIVAGINCYRRYASDAHYYLIELMREVVTFGWEPPSVVTEEEYNNASSLRGMPDALIGFIGFGCSFSGKWFGGYARGDTTRRYASNSKNSLLKKAGKLIGVTFKHTVYGAYTSTTQGCLIYCDPPYRGTTGYKGTGKFDSGTFWQWVRDRSKDNIVVVSEYSAPDDFECVLEIETKTDMRTKASGREKRVEKLFRLKKEVL